MLQLELNNWNYGAVNTHNWIPKHDPSNGLIVKWFVAGTDAGSRTITINTAGGVETITFNDGAHGFTDGDHVVYWHGDGNGAIGGLTDTRPYHVRVVDSTTIYLTLGGATSTSRVNLTSYGSFNGVSRSCFVTCFKPNAAYTSSSQEEMKFATNVPIIANNPNQALITITLQLVDFHMNNSDILCS